MTIALDRFSKWGTLVLALAGVLLATTPAQAADMSLSPNPVTSTVTPVTGTAISVTVGTWDAGVTLSYAWYRDTTLIGVATSSNYTPVTLDLGTSLRFAVTATKAGYTTITRELNLGVVVAPMGLSPVPTISGNMSIGGTLTANTGTWDSGVSLAYQWRRSGSDISGATSGTYLTSTNDAGYLMSVVVTGSKVGFSTTSRTSNTYALSNGSLSLTNAPQITGFAYVGEILSAANGTWDTGVTFTYQWTRDGYNISGATSATYQVVSYDLYDLIRVQVIGSKQGYDPVTLISAPTAAVKTAIPKISWVSPSSPLTGKSEIVANATKAFGGTVNISKWCLTLDGVPLTAPVGAAGIQFYNESQTLQTISSQSAGCYSSYFSFENLLKAKINYDVTKWALGNHTLSAIVTDYYGTVSLKVEITFAVAYTGPVVTLTPLNSSSPVVEAFTLSANSTTHSSQAPVVAWCVTVDGSPLKGNLSAVLKNAASVNQDAVLNSGRRGNGCFDSTSAVDYRSISITLDSKQYANGNHAYAMRAITSDGSTAWASTEALGAFSSKNIYLPTVKWGLGFSKVLPSGKASVLSARILANIPGNPSLVVFSTGTNSTWVSFARISLKSDVSVKKVFAKNTTVQVEVFDEDNKLVLTETQEVRVAPVVSVGSPSVTVKNSTSGKALKTLRYSAKISPGIAGSCTASWKLGGASGKAQFRFANGKGSFVVNPTGKGTGSLSIVCGGSGLASNAPYVVKMRVP